MYTAKIFTTAKRLEYIAASELEYKVIEEADENGHVYIELTIAHELDVLELFHTGIKYGMDAMDIHR
jgi:hypothetical protein